MKPATSPLQRLFLVAFGILCCVLLLEGGLRLGGLAYSSLQHYRNYRSLKQKGTYKILCLGESTTANQYPAFLEEELNKRNTGITFSVIDKGVVATNTWVILSSLASSLDAYHPDMVITMMGVNDRAPYMPHGSVSDSRAMVFVRTLRTYKLAKLLWFHIAGSLLHRFNKPTAQLSLLLHAIFVPPAHAEETSASPEEIETRLRSAIALNPVDDRAYLELGRCYRQQRKFLEAEALCKQAITLNPADDRAYVELGECYRIQGKLAEAEAACKKAIALNPANVGAYLELGRCYREQHKPSYASKAYEKAMELDPANDKACFELGRSYGEQGKLSEAVAACRKAVELNPRNDMAYGALGVLYREMGDAERAGACSRMARELRLSYYSPDTAGNYRKLNAILGKRGIVHVCVQYPMQDVEPLKKIFRDDAAGALFVDNERIFKDAVARDGYRAYFIDMFGGDFGHCTDKGNRLLAENIANVIVKEIFYN